MYIIERGGIYLKHKGKRFFDKIRLNILEVILQTEKLYKVITVQLCDQIII